MRMMPHDAITKTKAVAFGELKDKKRGEEGWRESKKWVSFR